MSVETPLLQHNNQTNSIIMVAKANKKRNKAKNNKAKNIVKRQLKVKRRGPRGPTAIMSGTQPGFVDAKLFRHALQNPFSAMAIGCRVPDSYAIPTSTYHIRNTISCVTGSGGGFACIILPSPCLTFVLSSGTITSSMTAFSQNTNCYYVASPTAVSVALTEYRVVSWGFRIIPKDTAFAAKGKYYLAFSPTTNNAPSWNTMETVTASNLDVIGEYLVGIGAATGNLGQIVNLPSVRSFTAQDLMRREIQFAGAPLSSSFYEFKGTTDRTNMPWASGQILADEGVFNHTTGLVNATAGGRKDIASLKGGVGALLRFTGGPADTNEFDIELIYHLEGTPNVGSATTGGAIVPSSQRVAMGSTHLVESVMSAIHTAGKIISAVQNPVQEVLALAAGAGLKGTKSLSFAK